MGIFNLKKMLTVLAVQVLTQSLAAKTIDSNRLNLNVSKSKNEQVVNTTEKRIVKIAITPSAPKRQPASIRVRGPKAKKIVVTNIGSPLSDSDVEPLALAQIKRLEKKRPVFVGPPEPRASETEPFMDHSLAREGAN